MSAPSPSRELIAADERARKRLDRMDRVDRARECLMSAASELTVSPESEGAWRELCSARATLRALARCAS